jgi:hypothetical protein
MSDNLFNHNYKERRRTMNGKILYRCMIFAMILLLAAATPVYAGFGGSATPDFPAVAQIYDMGVSVGLDLLPVITGGDTGPVTLVGITMIPSCGLRTGTGACASSEWDPGIFSVSSTGTGAGACAGINFTIAETDASSGEVTFTPSSAVTLNHLDNCRITSPLMLINFQRMIPTLFSRGFRRPRRRSSQ